jgi:hypothetical protein
MTNLYCGYNQLSELSIPNTIKILNCEKNQLTEFTFPSNSKLVQLNIMFNRLTNLSITKRLRTLYCENNVLTSLTFPLQSKLKILDCSNNQLTELTNLPQTLTELNCSNNLLTNLDDLPPNLIELECENNQLSRLDDLPSNLMILRCSNNLLEERPEMDSEDAELYDYNNLYNSTEQAIDEEELNDQFVANEGIAYEIHNEAEKINSKMQIFLDLISLPNHDNAFYKNQNIIDYIKPKFVNYIQEHFPEEKKESSIEKLNSILNKLAITNEIMNDANKRLIMGKCVDFVFSQPNDFIDFYVDVFIQDCFSAYEGAGNNISCSKGIYERFYMVIKYTCIAICPNPCDNELYSKIKLFFKDINEMTQEWSELHLETPELARMNKEERKQHYINFMSEKFKSINLLNAETEEEIRKEADKIDYVFETLEFGGSKKGHKKKGQKKTKKKTKKGHNKTKKNHKKTKKNKK